MQDISSDDPKLELNFLLHVLDADMHNDNNQYDLMPPSSRKKKKKHQESQQTPRRHQESRGERSNAAASPSLANYARVEEKILGRRLSLSSFSSFSAPASDQAVRRPSIASPRLGASGASHLSKDFVDVTVVLRFRSGAAEQHSWANAIRLTVAHMPGAIFHASATSVHGSVSSAAKNDLAGAGAAAETKTMASAPGQKTARARRAEPRLDASKQMLFLPFSAQTGYAATRT
jgi:hypothetical protein